MWHQIIKLFSCFKIILGALTLTYTIVLLLKGLFGKKNIFIVFIQKLFIDLVIIIINFLGWTVITQGVHFNLIKLFKKAAINVLI